MCMLHTLYINYTHEYGFITVFIYFIYESCPSPFCKVLLMEWCMLVRELDAIVQKEHIMEKTAEGQHAVKLLNEASSARRQQQQQEGPQHDAAEAASQTATAKREKKAPLPPRPAGLQDLPDFQIDGPTDVVYPAAAAAAAAEDDEVDEEEVSQWLQVEDAAAVEASTGGAAPAKPKKMTIAEAAAAGLADPTFAVAAAIEAENAGAAMSLESYATLPPSEKLKALCTPSMAELDVDVRMPQLGYPHARIIHVTDPCKRLDDYIFTPTYRYIYTDTHTEQVLVQLTYAHPTHLLVCFPFLLTFTPLCSPSLYPIVPCSVSFV